MSSDNVSPGRLAAIWTRLRSVVRWPRGLTDDLVDAVSREYFYHTATRTYACLFLTWGCTSRCSTCRIWRRQRDAEKELTCEEWLDVARTLVRRGVTTFELFGGDVLLRKDVLVPLTREIHALGAGIHMPTNANLLDRDTAAVLAENLQYVYLSTDGVDDQHDRVRGVEGTFGRVGRALKYLLEARGDRPYPVIVCNTTVSRHNVGMLARIAEFASEAGYDEINFEYVGEFTPAIVSASRIGDFEPSPMYLNSDDSSLIRSETVFLLRDQLRQARALARRGGSGSRGFRVVTVDIDMLSDANLVRGTIPFRRCFVERTEVVIDPYGNIVPCCFFDTYHLGSVRKGDLNRSLDTLQRLQFRRHRDAGRLAMCRHCIHSVVRNRTAVDVARRAYKELSQRYLERPQGDHREE